MITVHLILFYPIILLTSLFSALLVHTALSRSTKFSPAITLLIHSRHQQYPQDYDDFFSLVQLPVGYL